MKEHKFKIKLTLLKKIQYLRKYNFTTKEMRISFGSKFVVTLCDLKHHSESKSSLNNDLDKK